MQTCMIAFYHKQKAAARNNPGNALPGEVLSAVADGAKMNTNDSEKSKG